MSQTAVEQVLGKMLLDPAFRELAAADPSKALVGFDLTAEELEGFKKMDFNEFSKEVTGLDERVSKGTTLN